MLAAHPSLPGLSQCSTPCQERPGCSAAQVCSTAAPARGKLSAITFGSSAEVWSQPDAPKGGHAGADVSWPIASGPEPCGGRRKSLSLFHTKLGWVHWDAGDPSNSLCQCLAPLTGLWISRLLFYWLLPSRDEQPCSKHTFNRAGAIWTLHTRQRRVPTPPHGRHLQHCSLHR